MRAPDRIPRVFAEVERVWRLHPDMRLGQLIVNVATWADKPVWDIEEDVLTSEIDRHVKQYLERREFDEKDF